MKNAIRSLLHRFGYDIVQRRNANDNLSDHLMNVLIKYEVDCVLDVGANSGQFAQFLREIGYTGYIVCFEPVRRVFEMLQTNVAADPKCLCFHSALGDVDEHKEINVYKSTVFSSFLEATDYSKDIWNSLTVAPQLETVHVCRLDAIFNEISNRTGARNFYLKMDTQGYDLNVFRGAKRILDSIKALQWEMPLIAVYKDMPDAYDILREFNRENFYISGMYPINRDESLAVIEYDCVLVKRAPDRVT